MHIVRLVSGLAGISILGILYCALRSRTQHEPTPVLCRRAPEPRDHVHSAAARNAEGGPQQRGVGHPWR